MDSVDDDLPTKQPRAQVTYRGQWFWDGVEVPGTTTTYDGAVYQRGRRLPFRAAYARQSDQLDLSVLFDEARQKRRPRLEETSWWLPLMMRIEAYLTPERGRGRAPTLAQAVDRFDLVSLRDAQDELEAEASGDDDEDRRKRAAIAMLKAWRQRWRSLPDSVRHAEFS